MKNNRADVEPAHQDFHIRWLFPFQLHIPVKDAVVIVRKALREKFGLVQAQEHKRRNTSMTGGLSSAGSDSPLSQEHAIGNQGMGVRIGVHP